MVRKRSRRRRGESSSGKRRLVIGIILGVGLGMVGSGTIVAQAAHINDILFGPPGVERVAPNETLYMEVDEAKYMNRIFEERSHEIAFCGLIDRDAENRLEIWLADTVSASAETVEFLTDNCPPETGALIHTHPNGVLGLSKQDKQTLAKASEEVMCVQADQLSTEPDTRLRNLACYLQLQPRSGDGGLELARVPVVLKESLIVE